MEKASSLTTERRVIPVASPSEGHGVITMAGRRGRGPHRQNTASGAPRGETARSQGRFVCPSLGTHHEHIAPSGAPLPLCFEGAIDGDVGKLPRISARETRRSLPRFKLGCLTIGSENGSPLLLRLILRSAAISAI